MPLLHISFEGHIPHSIFTHPPQFAFRLSVSNAHDCLIDIKNYIDAKYVMFIGGINFYFVYMVFDKEHTSL